MIGCTGKSIDFERHMTAPEIWLVLIVGVDPRGYFLGGFNLFESLYIYIFVGRNAHSTPASSDGLHYHGNFGTYC